MAVPAWGTVYKTVFAALFRIQIIKADQCGFSLSAQVSSTCCSYAVITRWVRGHVRIRRGRGANQSEGQLAAVW